MPDSLNLESLHSDHRFPFLPAFWLGDGDGGDDPDSEPGDGGDDDIITDPKTGGFDKEGPDVQ